MSKKIDIDLLIEGAIELRECKKLQEARSKIISDFANKARQAKTEEERELVRKAFASFEHKNPDVIDFGNGIAKVVMAIGSYEKAV